jgi:hypothetical protein
MKEEYSSKQEMRMKNTLKDGTRSNKIFSVQSSDR